MLRIARIWMLAGIVGSAGCGGKIPMNTNPLSAEEKAKIQQQDKMVDEEEGRKAPAKKTKK